MGAKSCQLTPILLLPLVGRMTCPHGRCRGRDGRI